MKRENKKLQSVKKHLKRILTILAIYTIWYAAVFLFIALIQGLDLTIEQYGTGRRLYVNTIQSILKGTMVFYILIYHIAVPLIKDRKWKKFLLQCFLFFLFLTMYEFWFYYKVSDPAFVEGVTISPRTFAITAIVLDILTLLVSIFFASIMTSNEMRRRRDSLVKEKLRAELSAIKYQINPHFLFNSLSFIYTKTVKSSPEAAHAVHLLSEIMSYALDDWDALGTVPLRLEATQMKRVIEMNQIRFNNTLNVKYHEYIEPEEASVPILSLVTLVENAFKHGDLSDEKNPIMIKLNATKNQIYFMVRNQKKKEMIKLSHGIGLSNVKQRLQLMYGDKQSVVINENENNYLIEITINL